MSTPPHVMVVIDLFACHVFQFRYHSQLFSVQIHVYMCMYHILIPRPYIKHNHRPAASDKKYEIKLS